MQGVAQQSRQVPSVTRRNKPPPLEDPVPGIVNQMAAKERAVHLKMIEGQADRREANRQNPLGGETYPPFLSVSPFCALLAQAGCDSVCLVILLIRHFRHIFENC
jgi:hypothetical protein